jgi:RNA polymerase sigma-70 factor, Bacteroides expansion family 1
MDYGKYTDQELVPLVKAGDATAFAEVYERYWELLLRFALRVLQDQEQAEDAVQDVFLALWDKHHAMAEPHSLSAYLYGAVKNRVMNLIDRSKVRQAYLKAVADTVNGRTWLADDHLRARELAQLIEQEMQQMPEGMREVFRLSREEERSHREIAEELGISENTVKVQVSRALRKLRKSLHLLVALTIIQLFP